VKIWLLFGCVFLLGCQTTSMLYNQAEIDSAAFNGVVITEEGLPLEGADIIIDDLMQTKSDINGRFLFNALIYGKHQICVSKVGYIESDFEFEYYFDIRNRTKFIKIKLLSINFLLEEALSFLRNKNYTEADRVISMLELGCQEDSVIYIRAVYLNNTDKLEESATMLVDLVRRNRRNVIYKRTLIEVYHKMMWFRLEAELSVELGLLDPIIYKQYLLRAATIFSEVIKDEAAYNNTMRIIEQQVED